MRAALTRTGEVPDTIEDGIGPESITLKSAMAKYNSRDKDFSTCLKSA